MPGTTSVDAGGPMAPVRPRLPLPDPRRRRILDVAAAGVVRAGGAGIILAIVAILFVIVSEVAPLLRGCRVTSAPAVAVTHAAAPFAVGTDEYRELVWTASPDGFTVAAATDGAPVALDARAIAGVRLRASSRPRRGHATVLGEDGHARSVHLDFDVSWAGGARRVAPMLRADPPFPLALPDGKAPTRLAQGGSGNGAVVLASGAGPACTVIRIAQFTPLTGPPQREVATFPLALPADTGTPTALLADERGVEFYVGTDRGCIVRGVFDELGEPAVTETASVLPGSAVTVLGFLVGDRTLVVGGADGSVTTWQPVRVEGNTTRLRRMHGFASHPGPVTCFGASRRNKSFATGDAGGAVHLHFGTTGRTQARVVAPGRSLVALAIAPKSDGLVTLAADGTVGRFDVDDPHPEVTWDGLFGEVWYEGYDRPEYAWQSTGGTDDFEPKFSLAPLVFGTLKGTLISMLFAVPVALLAAVYAAQFMHPTLRGWIKPTVEIMAALPSVVMGLIAGLWLAPAAERIVPGILVAPFVLGGLLLVAGGIWHALPSRVKRLRPGFELVCLVPLVAGGLVLALGLGRFLEAACLGGDYRAWLKTTLDLTFDQRNSLVVGFAMGFAVIPLVFTIADDALANVPSHLTAGSLALGATRWQTVVGVVLPTASPGIFSAVMIGFGRAVGETMIVLMATGNTPIMEWSVFNGFRALSANIAVELPEAPEGGTLYRVLFLGALLLFGMTFCVNTVAELVRLRLRQKYKGL